MIMMTVILLTISFLTFTSQASSTSDKSEASAGSGTCRSSFGLGVGESLPLLSHGLVLVRVEVTPLVLSLGGLLA